MKRFAILLILPVLLIPALGCSISLDLPRVDLDNIETGSTNTLAIEEPLPDGEERAVVRLRMSAGTLNIEGGANGLVEGEIEYNVARWEPEIERSGDRLTIMQDRIRGGLPGDRVINHWDLRLGDIPLDLAIEAGAYQGTLDLSGLSIVDLSISDGASDAQVTFDEPNPERMRTFRYETGASQVRLNGLANANFEELVFEGGTGNYRLDFSGELQQDARAQVTSGLSNLDLIFPEDMAVEVRVTGGLNNVSTSGRWTINDDVYTREGAGPQLLVEVEMGLGNLNIDVR
ncbi:MAG TPA: toast rack family protein [Anaerolineaceae bacterium]|nr:toast rack family protein [Anaerolineaceae bacterium]